MKKFTPTPWPEGLKETPEIFTLQTAHARVIKTVSDFESATAAITQDRKLSTIARSVEIERAEQEAIAEFGRIERDELRYLQEDLRRQRDEIDRVHIPGDAAAMQHMETRNALRELTATKRKTVITEALENKDVPLIRAIETGTALLCGLTTQEYSKFQEQANEVLHGEDKRNLDQAAMLLKELRGMIANAREYIETFETKEMPLAV